MSTGAALLDLSRRATDAVLSLGIMAFDMPDGTAIAVWAPGQPWHGQPEGRTGEDIDAWALLDDVVAGKAVFDLRDPLTRAGALPLLVAEAFGAWRAWVNTDGNGRYDVWWQKKEHDDGEFCHLYASGISADEACAYADCDHSIGCDGSPAEALVMALEWAATQRKEQA